MKRFGRWHRKMSQFDFFRCLSAGNTVLLRPQPGHFLSDPVIGVLRQLINLSHFSHCNPYRLTAHRGTE
jgi:hypothetical protein